MSSRIYMSPPDTGELEEEYVVRALRTGWVAPLGPEVDAFEADLAARASVSHALALNSGTSALHLALLAVGVRPGDTVIVATLTFAATAFAVRYAGAKTVFVDCDAETGNMSPEHLETAISDSRERGENVAAVLAVDLLGRAANYTDLEAITRREGIVLIADAAESLGATHAGRPTGSYGLAAAYSFNGNKIITTSGGGALVSDDGDLIARARHLATQAREPVSHFEHRDIGYNYRLSNVLAAIGRAQLSRLDGMIERRRQVRLRYEEYFAAVPGVNLLSPADAPDDNFWLTSIIVDHRVAGWRAHDLALALTAEQIESRPLWKPMHLQPVFAGDRSYLDGSAQHLFDNGVTLPSGSTTTTAELDRVIESVEAFRGARS